MKKALVILFALFALALASTAQSPVRWRASVKMTSPTEGEITIKALIAEGWHLYGLEMPDGGPKPTRFNFSDSKGIRTDGDIRPSEPPIVQMDPLFGKNLSWWDRNVTFTQRFTLRAQRGASQSRHIVHELQRRNMHSPKNRDYHNRHPEIQSV